METMVLSVGLVAAKGDFRIDLGAIVGFILVGIVVGVVARLLVPGSTHLGIVGTIAVGIVGAVVGGWLAGAVFEETPGIDWIASIAVAILLVLLLRSTTRRRTFGRRVW